MNDMEMLFAVAYERLKESCQKAGNYVFTHAHASIKNGMPLYIHYALKEGDMDVLSVTFTVPDWFVTLDITWTENGDIYSLNINGEEADSLCPRNILTVVPSVKIKLLEDALLCWLIKTDFDAMLLDDDPWI